MPAVNKLTCILRAAELEVIMVDAGHSRFIDLYCQPRHEEEQSTESGDESEEEV